MTGGGFGESVVWARRSDAKRFTRGQGNSHVILKFQPHQSRLRGKQHETNRNRPESHLDNGGLF